MVKILIALFDLIELAVCKTPYISILLITPSNPHRDYYIDVLGIVKTYFPAKLFTTRNGYPSKLLPIVITDNRYAIYFLYLKFIIQSIDSY